MYDIIKNTFMGELDNLRTGAEFCRVWCTHSLQENWLYCSCSCPMTGDLTSPTCVCGCMVNGASTAAVAREYYYYSVRSYDHKLNETTYVYS